MTNTKVAIVGASGYSGEELVRLLLQHPHAELTAVTSRQYAGQTVAQVFPKFSSYPRSKALRFSEPKSELLAKAGPDRFPRPAPWRRRRIRRPAVGPRLPGHRPERRFPAEERRQFTKNFTRTIIPRRSCWPNPFTVCPKLIAPTSRTPRSIASPGCYPTSMLLPLIPLLKAKSDQIHRHHRRLHERRQRRRAKARSSIISSSNATKACALTAFPNTGIFRKSKSNFQLAAGEKVVIQFTPHLIPVNRGILTTLYLAPEKHFSNAAEMSALGRTNRDVLPGRLRQRTLRAPARRQSLPDTKNVVGTNVIEIAWRLDPRTGRLIVMSANDNIMKGASGQAVQSMNIICGYPETAGLL